MNYAPTQHAQYTVDPSYLVADTQSACGNPRCRGNLVTASQLVALHARQSLVRVQRCGCCVEVELAL